MDYDSLKFTKSRIPALDALSAFVPTGHENDEVIRKTRSERRFSRWFPMEGGHKVLFRYEGGDYDTTVFSIEKRAWDHEHCKECDETIPPMTLCWVTESGPFVILCTDCHARLIADE